MSPASAEGGDTERYVCPTHGEVTPSDEWLEQMGWVCPEQDCSEALERPAQGFWVEVDGTPVHVQGGPMNEKTQAVLFDIARAAFRKMDAEDVGDVQNMIEHAPTEPNAPAPRGAEQERWTIWLCPDCGYGGCEVSSSGKSHRLDSKDGERCPACERALEPVEVVPASLLDAANARAEEARELAAEATRAHTRAIHALAGNTDYPEDERREMGTHLMERLQEWR
jgi:hypothetical protein